MESKTTGGGFLSSLRDARLSQAPPALKKPPAEPNLREQLEQQRTEQLEQQRDGWIRRDSPFDPPSVPGMGNQAPVQQPSAAAPRTDVDDAALRSAPSLVAALLGKNRGVFIGDEHGTIGVQKALQDVLKTTAAKVLFVEMFDSKDQAYLNAFTKDGDKGKLVAYLKENGWDKAPGWAEAVVDSLAIARDRGIRLHAIDDSRIGGDRRLDSNAHWDDVITASLASLPPDTKYLVFGGSGHSARYERNKGIDARLGIPSVDFQTPQSWDRKEIQDLKPGQLIRSPDPLSADFVARPK